MKCRICQNDTQQAFDPQFHFYYYICPTCLFIFADPATLLSAEKEKMEYLRHQNSLDNHGYVEMLEKFICWGVAPFVSPGQAILDFGSGPCPVLKSLMDRHGFKASAYDPYFASLWTHAAHSFAAVTATEVLEHFYDPLSEINKIVKALKPGGYFALTTHFHPVRCDNERLLNEESVKLFLSWWYRRDPVHVSFYTPQTLAFIGDLFGLKPWLTDGVKGFVFKKNQ